MNCIHFNFVWQIAQAGRYLNLRTLKEFSAMSGGGAIGRLAEGGDPSRFAMTKQPPMSQSRWVVQSGLETLFFFN